MKKGILMILALLIVSGSVWAGGSMEQTSSGDEPVTIEIWSWAEEEMQTIVDAIQPEFPNVTYKINVFPWGEIFTKVQSALAAGQGPDIYYLPHDRVDDFWSRGMAVDFTDYGFSPDILRDDFFPFGVDFATMRGGFYEIGWKAAPFVYFYDNAKAEKYFGTSDPSVIAQYTLSFDKLMEMAAIVSEKSGRQDFIAAGPNHIMQAYMWHFHEPLIAADGKINSKVLLDTFSYLEKLVDLNVLTIVEGGGAAAISQVFNQGRFFGEVAGPWALAYYFMYALPEEVGTFSSTSFYPGLQGYWGLNVNPNSKNIQIAVDSIKSFVTDPKKMYSLLSPTYDFPLSKTVINMMKDQSSEYLQQAPFSDWNAAAQKLTIGPEFEEKSNQINKFIDPVFQTMVEDPGVTAQQALDMLIEMVTNGMPGTYK